LGKSFYVPEVLSEASCSSPKLTLSFHERVSNGEAINFRAILRKLLISHLNEKVMGEIGALLWRGVCVGSSNKSLVGNGFA
jgi:hypothetical protein